MTKMAFTAWIALSVGVLLWLYGLSGAGHPSLVEWPAKTPSWFLLWVPNLEAEIGILLAIIGAFLVSRPRRL